MYHLIAYDIKSYEIKFYKSFFMKKIIKMKACCEHLGLTVEIFRSIFFFETLKSDRYYKKLSKDDDEWSWQQYKRYDIVRKFFRIKKRKTFY